MFEALIDGLSLVLQWKAFSLMLAFRTRPSGKPRKIVEPARAPSTST